MRGSPSASIQRFQFLKRRSRLFWEIEKRGLVLIQRSWARSRPERIQTQTFRSRTAIDREANKRTLEMIAREFYPIDATGAVKKGFKKPPSSSGPEVVAEVKRALVAIVVPRLRELDFDGTFPSFRRVEKDRHSVVWFWWGRAQGFVSPELGVVSRKAGTSAAQDLRRAINIRNKQRTELKSLIPHKEAKYFHFDHAMARWGADWARQMAALIVKRIEGPGDRWLRSPDRKRGRVSP